MTIDPKHAARVIARCEEERLTDDLVATADRLAIREAAVLGFRLQIANEMEGIEIDRRRGAPIDEREERLATLRRAEARLRGWNPLRRGEP